jgi:alpha-tubulin suppressor-like RCC1 family protein
VARLFRLVSAVALVLTCVAPNAGSSAAAAPTTDGTIRLSDGVDEATTVASNVDAQPSRGATGPVLTDLALSPSTTTVGSPVAFTATASSSAGVAGMEVSVAGGPWWPLLPTGGSTSLGSTSVGFEGHVGLVATAIASGWWHTCAVLRSGAVACWGDNNQGQLGNGTIDTAATSSVRNPVIVVGLTDAVAVGAGEWHTCAVHSGGTVSCWGFNGSGELGNGTTTSSATPVTVSGISNAVAVSGAIDNGGANGAYDGSTCALLGDGTVECWGDNYFGELGNGTTTNSSTPVPVTGISTATAIGLGRDQACALLSDGTVECWGESSGSTPVPVSGITGAAAISVGDRQACAALEGGTVMCWHDGTVWSLDGISNATAVATGDGSAFSCSILADRTVSCQGSNEWGQLGTGWAPSSGIPGRVSGLSNAIAIAAGFDRACALLAEGTVSCWGYGASGRLGVSATPVKVSGIATAVQVAPGYDDVCAVLSAGTVECWGYNGEGQLGNGTTSASKFMPNATPVTVSGINNAVAVGAGEDFECALLSTGTVKCWGYNHYGSLGNGTTTDSSTPVAVTGISNATAIAVGGYSACALLSGGTIKCWGANFMGQLGNGTGLDSSTPVAVSYITTAIQVVAGWHGSCALLSDGTIKCWGAPIGDGSTSTSGTPVAVAGISTATQVAENLWEACALLAGGSVMCWGDNQKGELGNGTVSGISLAPVAVTGITTATAITVGHADACALLAGGTVSCWGLNNQGDLGNGTWDDSSVPVPVIGITSATSISSGGQTVCAVLTGGSLACWGSDGWGKLGTGSTADSATPVGVVGFTGMLPAGPTQICVRATDYQWNSSDGTTCETLTVSTWNDFAVTANPSSLAVVAGGTGTMTVSTAIVSGSAESISLSVSGLPNGATATFAPSSVTAGGTSTVTLTFGASVALGTYALTVIGTAASVTRTTPIALTVPRPSTYFATSPHRILDTRPTVKSGNPTCIGLSGKFSVGVVRTFTVARANYVGGGAAAAVPADAVAITANLTIVNETAPGVIDLGPAATASGSTSSLSFVKGDIRANNVTIGLAADGSLSAVYRSSTPGATTDLILDITGYFLPGTSGAGYHTVTPGRILDTRPTGSAGATHIGPLSKLVNRTVKTFAVSGVKPLGGASALVPAGAVAVTGNLTVTNATSVGYVSLGPTMTANPSTSTVNVPARTNVANGVTVALNGGKLSVVWCGTAGSKADVIFDVTGYFTAAPGGLSFYAVDPVRILDSSVNLGISGPFASRTAQLFGVGGSGAIPANAAGISGNVTLINPSTAGWALVSPEIVASPTTSTVNASAGRSEANGFNVLLGSGGHVALEWAGTTGSTANLALDVTGYWR